MLTNGRRTSTMANAIATTRGIHKVVLSSYRTGRKPDEPANINPHPPKIAASIIKTSKACFNLPKACFIYSKPVSTHNSNLFYPRSLFLSTKACVLSKAHDGSQPIFPSPHYLCPFMMSPQSTLLASPSLLLMLLVRGRMMVSQPAPL